MKLNKSLIAALITGPALLLTGCSDSQQGSDSAQTESKATAPAVANDPHAGMTLHLANNQGKVLQATSEGGYTYAEVEQNGNTFWIAGSQTALKPGDIATWRQAQEMKNVHSKVLDRTFDSIYFVTEVSTNRARSNLNTGGSSQPAVNHGNSGKVLSAQNAAGYSYLEVETHVGTRWVAAPQAAIEPGQTVTWSGASPMRNFTSKALNKTFDEILFAGRVQVIDPSAVAAAPAASVNQGKVLSVKTGGGYSYVEVETSAGNKWVAAPQAQIEVGDTVSWSGANMMRNFSSSSLGQTFDEILFAGGLTKVN